MTRHTEHFHFKLLDEIIVKAIQRPGIVDALTVDSLGTQYRILYWCDAVRKSEWMYEFEIELRKAE